MNLFKRQKTLAEIQEEDELAAANLSLTKKRAMIYRLERQMGKGSWRNFSDNGKRSGVNFGRVRAWLREH